MELIIKEEFKSLLPPLTSEEYKILEESLLVERCREPLIIWNDILVDGHNRYEICQRHGIQFRTTELEADNIEDVKIWIIDNQKGRRNLTDGWKYELAQARKEILLKLGKETQGMRTDLLSTIDKKLDPHNTRNEIAEDLGWSTGKVAMADKVWRDASAEIKEQVKSGELSINEVYKEIRKEDKIKERKKQIQEIKEKIAFENNTIEDKYDVISIDPPWNYDTKYDPETRRGIIPYPGMATDEIAKIELPLKDNAVVFLWTTHAFIRDAFRLIDIWGLEYKAIITWDKEIMGIGVNIRMQCEFCLLCTKGKPLIEGSSERDIIRESRREHSRKPESFYLMVERMTTGRRLDYFARQKRENWDVYGIETGKF